MVVVMERWEEAELGPNDFRTCRPGEDAWMVGDEACVVVDWQGVAGYAKVGGG